MNQIIFSTASDDIIQLKSPNLTIDYDGGCAEFMISIPHENGFVHLPIRLDFDDGWRFIIQAPADTVVKRTDCEICWYPNGTHEAECPDK